jgi:hypothetical protein
VTLEICVFPIALFTRLLSIGSNILDDNWYCTVN